MASGDNLQSNVTISTLSSDINNLEFEDFLDYLTSEKKASFIVLYTAKGEKYDRCQLCEDVTEQFEIVANSHRRSDTFKDDRLFFGQVDFKTESDISEMVQFEKAPVLMHYPPSGKPVAADSMDLEAEGVEAQTIANWVEARTRVKIKILPPSFFYEPRRFLTALFMRWKKILTEPDVVGTAAVLFCFEMSSGMYAVSETSNSKPGDPPDQLFMVDSMNSQFPIECFIIMFLYAGYTIGLIMVIRGLAKRGRKGTDSCILGIAMVVGFFSLIMCAVRNKLSNYPFKFLL